MAAIQLNFTLRTSENCKTVHLLGSWDNYAGQLPLSKDPSKAGGWKGTFRFQGATLKQGQRYWYYYIIDGYHVSHDPAREHTTEPTTGRKLNILDIPKGKGGEAKAQDTAPVVKPNRRTSADVPKGRALSPSQIQSPRPSNPQQLRKFATTDYQNHPTVEQLAVRYSHPTESDNSSFADSSSEPDDSSSGQDSDSDSDLSVPSLTSRSTNSSSPSSVSSASSCCTCERYGITRKGERVKLDCGGAKCGNAFSESGSDHGETCSSESEGEYRNGQTRRQGVVVRR